jgi:hypothetical protein
MGSCVNGEPKWLFAAAMGLVCLALPGSLRANIIQDLTYNVTLETGIDGISDIIFLNQLTDQGIGSSHFYSLPAGNGSATQEWPIEYKGRPFPQITDTIAIGLATGVPGDAGPALAVFGGYTTGEVGESFSTLFPDANESKLISDIENLPVEGCLLDPTCPVNIASDVVPFFDDAVADGLFIAPGQNFDVVAYTNGQLIGTGSLVETRVTTTPEPSSTVLLGLSLGLVAVWRRRRLKMAGH